MAEVNYSGENGTFKSEFIVRRQGEEFLSYSIYPMAVPPSKRLAVAELIVQFDSRTSYNTLGNYELNWDSGQLRYKTSIDFKGGEFNRILAARAAYYCVASMDGELPLFRLVIEEDVPPTEALAQFYDYSDEDEEFNEDYDDFEEQESFDDN
jgi:hypothetical protein